MLRTLALLGFLGLARTEPNGAPHCRIDSLRTSGRMHGSLSTERSREEIRVFTQDSRPADCYERGTKYVVSLASPSHASVFTGFILTSSGGRLDDVQGGRVSENRCATHSDPSAQTSAAARWSPGQSSGDVTFKAMSFRAAGLGLQGSPDPYRGTYAFAQDKVLRPCRAAGSSSAGAAASVSAGAGAGKTIDPAWRSYCSSGAPDACTTYADFCLC